MESTANFMAGLKLAHEKAHKDGVLKKAHDEVLKKLFAAQGVSPAKKKLALDTLHAKVRELYISQRTQNFVGPLKRFRSLFKNIDWTKVIVWLISNLPTIIEIAITILPMLL
jgi:hypothetical protein